MLVVKVLLAPGRIDPGCLQMPTRVHANPHIPPGRRDHELSDPLKHLGVVDPLSVRVEVLKPTAAPSPGNTWRRAIATPQSRDRRAPINAAGPSHTVSIYPALDGRQTKPLLARTGSRRR